MLYIHLLSTRRPAFSKSIKRNTQRKYSRPWRNNKTDKCVAGDWVFLQTITEMVSLYFILYYLRDKVEGHFMHLILMVSHQLSIWYCYSSLQVIQFRYKFLNLIKIYVVVAYLFFDIKNIFIQHLHFQHLFLYQISHVMFFSYSLRNVAIHIVQHEPLTVTICSCLSNVLINECLYSYWNVVCGGVQGQSI